MTAARLLTALDPTGFPPVAEGVSLAPRPSSLDGKVVYLVDCRFEDADRLLDQVQRWFAERMPSVETRFVRWPHHGFEPDPATLARIAADGDAAILAVGI